MTPPMGPSPRPALVSATLVLTVLLPLSGLGAGGVGSPAGGPEAPHLRGAGHQAVLQEEALRFVRAWVNGDDGSLASMLVAQGIRLQLQGDLYPSVDLRRGVEALRAFLGRYPGGEAELMRVSQASGTPGAGFAEFQWRTRVAGTGEGVIFTLFLAFAMEEGTWIVTEIRVLS